MAEVTEELVSFALSQPFPGTEKWVAGHPIWEANVGNKPSPKEAWHSEELLKKAVDNMLYIIEKSSDTHFVELHKEAIERKDIVLSRKILSRFTIAKIAPKVTALRETDLLKMLSEADLHITNGVYCPMAGFGGIVRAAQQLGQEVEAYDINSNICAWYGWRQRDVLAQVIDTDKTVVACPPFGKDYEHWKGTPREMSDIDFVQWTKLIREHVRAPSYVFIGPEVSSKTSCGLFAKTTGIQIWSEKMLENH